MAKTIARLTTRQVESGGLKPGLHSDGGNLYLAVGKDGGGSWAFIYRFDGRRREAGLGRAGRGGVSLADARAKAKQGRAMLDQRPPVDPLTVWRPAPVTSVPTFAEAAASYIALHEPLWKGAKSGQQWRSSLARYCRPLMKLPVDQIDMATVRKTLELIWTKIPETASRLRGRIEAIIDFGMPDGAATLNPARWRGGLAEKLPSPKGLGKGGHFAALPYKDIPAFARRLRAEDGVAARGLEFLVLTATRTNEARGAKWSEVDFDAKTWTIPIERLKSGRKTKKALVIPLSERALEIAREMRKISVSDCVFPGRFDGQPLNETAFLKLLQQRMGLAGITTHGFRSSFRDFAGDETNFPREVCEAALGHVVGGVEAAYRRSDALEKRRELMELWSRYCESSPSDDGAGNVVPFESPVRARGIAS